MQIQIRKTISTDLDFYQHCFEDKEFRWNIFGTSGLDISKFVSEEKNHYKYIISIFDNHNTEDTAFAHFYFNSKSNYYDFVGGINPKYFNSGVGVYACVAFLYYFFSENSFNGIETHVFKHNIRSLRMLLAVGFEIIYETIDKIVLRLTYNKMKNEFVNSVLNKIDIIT